MLNLSAVCLAGMVQVFVAIAPTQRFHPTHPEAVSVGAQDVNGLAESPLDSEL
jgi:hypothetical protein